MGDDMTPQNWFDQDHSQQSEPPSPPLPDSEESYGVIVPFKGKKGKKREGWQSEWQLADTGTPLPNFFNAMIVLRNHPGLSGLLKFDEMAMTTMIMCQIPGTPHDPTIPRPLRDGDVLAIQEEMQLTGLRRIQKQTVQDAVQLRAEQTKFHPVREYLDQIVWDGTSRVDNWLSYYLGAVPDEKLRDNPQEAERVKRYISKIGRLFLIALIARQYSPGCKADYMLILEGPQGAMKSSACKVLAGQWFSDNLPDLSRGDAVRLSMHLRGKWLIEIAEMSSFNSAEAHTLKEFLTQTEERYTPKYARQEVHEPRQCLFIGSTNEATYLRDATGARRFWPVKVGFINLADLAADRDQLLAEAVALFKAGEPWWPDRDFEAEFIAPEQADRYERDAWEPTVIDWLDGNPVVDQDSGFTINRPRRDKCLVTEVLSGALGFRIGQIGTREQRRVSAILRSIGWVQHRREYYRNERQV